MIPMLNEEIVKSKFELLETVSIHKCSEGLQIGLPRLNYPDRPTINRDNIKSLKLKAVAKHTTGIVFEVEVEVESNIYHTEISYPIELGMELLTRSGMHEDGSIDGDYYFLKFCDEKDVLIISEKTSCAQNKLSDVRSYEAIKSTLVNYDDIQLKDIVTYDGSLYYVLDKYKTVKLKTKSETVEFPNYKKFKTMEEKMLILFKIERFSFLYDSCHNLERNKIKRFLKKHNPSKISYLVGKGGIMVDNSKMHLITSIVQPVASDEFYQRIHSEKVNEFTEVLLCCARAEYQSNLIKSFEKTVYFNKNGKVLFDELGYISMNLNSLSHFGLASIKKIIQLFKFEDAATDKVIKGFIGFEEARMPRKVEINDLKVGQAYADCNGSKRIYCGKKFALVPSITNKSEGEIIINYCNPPKEVWMFAPNYDWENMELCESDNFSLYNEESIIYNNFLSQFIKQQDLMDDIEKQVPWERTKRVLETYKMKARIEEGELILKYDKSFMNFKYQEEKLYYTNFFIYYFDSMEELEGNIHLFTIPENLIQILFDKK